MMLETGATSGLSPMESEIQSLWILKKFFRELTSGEASARTFVAKWKSTLNSPTNGEQ
jgi:hypothetical protein